MPQQGNGTKFEFQLAKPRPGKGAVLIVPLTSKPKPAMTLVSAVDQLCEGAVAQLIEAGALREDPAQLIHTAARGLHRRVVVVTLGETKTIDRKRVRTAATAVCQWLIAEQLTNATIWIDGLRSCPLDRPVSEFAYGLQIAGFKFAEFSKPDKPMPAKVRIDLASEDNAYLKRKLPTIREHAALADAVNYARTIGHRPANIINPTTLADEARKLANTHKLTCKVHGDAALKRFKMGGLLAVGGGSKNKPVLIELAYRGAPRAKTHTVVVGKAITFDTGGYSLKPSASMLGMKYDKCGGATVLGIIKAAAALKLRCNVTALLATAENMVSEDAYRPNDIITMANGTTVEVTNTDAEGRLVLADALWYAQEHCKPTEVVDFATLTGGVVVALGKACAGIMSTHDDLCANLREAGRHVDERLWRLPLWDDYRELMKSNDADILNSSSKRHAHPIQGGIFLKEFIKEKTAWAHIDIAGPATDDSDANATGFGVRLMIEYLNRRAG